MPQSGFTKLEQVQQSDWTSANRNNAARRLDGAGHSRGRPLARVEGQLEQLEHRGRTFLWRKNFKQLKRATSTKTRVIDSGEQQFLHRRSQ